MNQFFRVISVDELLRSGSGDRIRLVTAQELDGPAAFVFVCVGRHPRPGDTVVVEPRGESFAFMLDSAPVDVLVYLRKEKPCRTLRPQPRTAPPWRA